jgi:hypothetical protein
MHAAPGEGMAGAPPGLRARLERAFKENERAVAASFFAAGFVFDMLTVGRVDSWATISQQALYLAAIMAVLLQMFHEQGQPAPEPAALPRVKRWILEYRGAAVHFLLGALLNLYAIFFFKSSSLAVSFAFLGFLVVLLLANESRRFKALGLPFKFALLALCLLSFFATLLPVLAGSIGLAMFLASMAAGSVPLAAAGWWIGRSSPGRFALARRQILVPLGCVVAGFLAFYLFRLIPPVPLSIPFIGVYHAVERTAEGFRLTHERDWWRFWHHGDQAFHAQPGDKVYVFFRIVSPARFADEVQLRWYWRAGGGIGGWALQDTIPINIVGGREQGFRGYGFKSNYQPGQWKAQVETTDGREIGRIYFDLEPAAQAPRIWQSVYQ